MSRGLAGALLTGRIRDIPPEKLTKPAQKLLKLIICNNQCDTCPLYLKGCAGNCNRFPTDVCASCPCRSSPDASNVNDAPVCPLMKVIAERNVER